MARLQTIYDVMWGKELDKFMLANCVIKKLQPVWHLVKTCQTYAIHMCRQCDNEVDLTLSTIVFQC